MSTTTVSRHWPDAEGGVAVPGELIDIPLEAVRDEFMPVEPPELDHPKLELGWFDRHELVADGLEGDVDELTGNRDPALGVGPVPGNGRRRHRSGSAVR